MALGRRIEHRPAAWLRGPARLEDGFVVLDSDRAEEYVPWEEEGLLLYDLAAIRRPHDALGFARRWGLLHHGPGADEYREPFRDWENEALVLTGALAIYRALRLATGGDPDGFAELRGRWADALVPESGKRPVSDEDYLANASSATAALVSEKLEGVEQRITAEADYGGDPGVFAYFVNTPDLVAHAWFELSSEIVQRVPLSTCPECGRIFPVKHGRQRFCDERCAARARYRRFAEKKQRA